MLPRTRMILSIAVAAVFGARSVFAADGESARDTAQTPLTTPLAITPTATNADVGSRAPLMSLFDAAGFGKTLDDAHIQIYGHAEGSYTYNFDSPPTSLSQYKLPVGKFIDNPGRVFDVENEKILLNQLTLNFARAVDPSNGQFDVGGRIELLYGSDARFTHSNGMFDHYDNDSTTRITGGPLNQFDIPNAYADIAIPVGNGLNIRVGKFTFFKQIDPNASVFYSHSFTFGGALPFSLTGAYATYAVDKDKKLIVEAGASRGWDQSFDDNNGSIDAFGRVKYQVNDKLALSIAAITGPEQDGDNSNWRTAVDFTATYAAADKLTLLADLVYGQQANPTGGGNDAHWYGVALYGVYELCNEASFAARLEWYRDEGGYTTGIDQTLYEATVGLTIRPFSKDKYLANFMIRPELRLDYSDKDYFDGFSRHVQVTAALDAVYNF